MNRFGRHYMKPRAMLDDFGESDNTVIWGNEACGAAVLSLVREVRTEFGMYVAAGRIVLTPPELVLSVSGAEETNSGFFLKIILLY